MDNDDRMIDDWLSGEECDPTDYDLYEINRFKQYFGQDDDEEDASDEPDGYPDDDPDCGYDEYDDSEE